MAMKRPVGRPRHLRVFLEGYEKAWGKAKNIEEALPLLLGAALHSEAKRIMRKSKSEYVPVRQDYGALMASGYVNKPVFAGPIVEVELGYGGTENVQYAAWLHEHPRAGKTKGVGPGPRFQHYKSWADRGRWKFLQAPAEEAAPIAAKRVAEEVRLNLQAIAKRL